MNTIIDTFRQCFFIPAPTFTDKQLPDQTGRVCIVTGGYAGVGKELCTILYGKNATVYLAGRSEEKANKALAEIKSAHPSSDGRLEFLHLDLSDLPTIKPAAEAFLRREQRLDVLTNNAGVMMPPVGTLSAQNYEIQLATNVLGPWLFTHHLTPLLQKTAAMENTPAGSVRVTWAASLATMGSPRGGVAFDEQTKAPKVHKNKGLDYAQSKASNVLLAREFQARCGDKAGVVSNAWNPGNLLSELQRHQGTLERILTRAVCYQTVYGAYTELFAGFSEEAGRPERKGLYIGPWGRFVALRGDIAANHAGAARLWEWCEQECNAYL